MFRGELLRQYSWLASLSVWLSKVQYNDDVVKWKNFPRYWLFVRGIHQWPVNSPHKGQWRGALMFSLICTWINGWVDNRKAGDLRRRHANYDVTTYKDSMGRPGQPMGCLLLSSSNSELPPIFVSIMTSSTGNIIPRYCPFVQFIRHRWIPLTNASGAELWCFAYLNKRLSKQSRHRWFRTTLRSLWRHWNECRAVVL